MFKFVEIQSIPRKIIKLDGKWYYKHHYCEYCGKRIPYGKKSLSNHNQKGIPTHCHGHNPKSRNGFKKGFHPPTEFKKGYIPAQYIDGFGSLRSTRRDVDKKRGLGFIELNSPSKKAHSPHHIDKERVVWIPQKLHFRFRHSVKTGKNLMKVNKLAFEWLNKQRIELQRPLFSF